jgi:hypothetical protein
MLSNAASMSLALPALATMTRSPSALPAACTSFANVGAELLVGSTSMAAVETVGSSSCSSSSCFWNRLELRKLTSRTRRHAAGGAAGPRLYRAGDARIA